MTATRAMTLTEKVIARAAGRPWVSAGDEVWATADRMIMNDSSGPRRFASLVDELGGVWDPSRVVVVSDHFVPASSVRHAEILRATRRWSADAGVRAFFEYEGILHNLVLQEHLVHPGMLLVGADSHTTTAGAMAAVAVPVGSTELATVLATGQLWMQVPRTTRIELSGRLAPMVDVRDVTLTILAEHGGALAPYGAIEYAGSFVDGLSLAQRMVLTNQGVAMGAKNAIVVPTESLTAALAGVELAAETLYPDPGADYHRRLRYDVDDIAPLVAAPPSPDNVVPAGELDEPIDMAWIGSCVGGRSEDLHAAARVLAGKRVAVPTLVTPATRAIYAACAADDTLAVLAAAGATIMPPGCGACAGVHAGVQGGGDRVIATATRNFPGRMGSRESQVYLGSSYTVAASALRGRITDPRMEIQ